MRPRASSVDSKAAQGQGKVEQKLRDHVVARTCRLADAMLRASSQHIRELWKISNTELRLLSTLENEESLPMVEIVRRALVDQAWVSRSLRVLESKKMVERRADPHDSRSIRVSLTRKGRQILEESRPYAQWSEECLLKGVDAKKLKELMDQLEANTQNMLSALAPFQKKHPKDQTNPS
jgi:DNA-binding MarR family transcriptional regulator